MDTGGVPARHRAGPGGAPEVVLCVAAADLALRGCTAGASDWLGAEPRRLLGRRLDTLLAAPGDEPFPPLARLAGASGPVIVELAPLGGGQPLALALEALLGDGEPLLILSRATGDAAALRERVMTELLGPLGHDLNNLFSVILGSLALLREDLSPDDELEAVIDDALSAGRDGAALVEKLVATAGRQVMRATRVDVRALVARLADLIGRSLPPSIELRLRAATDLPAVKTDPAHLESALLELVVNAREAMPLGGHLGIEIERSAPGEARGWVAIRITDDGCGMDPETLASARDPFFTTHRPRRGRGLGLGTVCGFARRCAGDVDIESSPGHGTRVTLRLPALG